MDFTKMIAHKRDAAVSSRQPAAITTDMLEVNDELSQKFLNKKDQEKGGLKRALSRSLSSKKDLLDVKNPFAQKRGGATSLFDKGNSY